MNIDLESITLCTYCGSLANTKDHIIPLSLWKASKDTTPSCWDCNCRILRNKPLTCIYARASYILSVLEKRKLTEDIQDRIKWCSDVKEAYAWQKNGAAKPRMHNKRQVSK